MCWSWEKTRQPQNLGLADKTEGQAQAGRNEPSRRRVQPQGWSAWKAGVCARRFAPPVRLLWTRATPSTADGPQRAVGPYSARTNKAGLSTLHTPSPTDVWATVVFYPRRVPSTSTSKPKKKKEGRKGKRTKKKEGKRKERFDRASQTTTGLAVFPTAPSHALAASGRAAEHARGGSRQASSRERREPGRRRARAPSPFSFSKPTQPEVRGYYSNGSPTWTLASYLRAEAQKSHLSSPPRLSHSHI
jgi:hypothetical protein